MTGINFSCIKLSELPVSNSAVKECPFIFAVTVASFPKDEESQVARIVEKDWAADAITFEDCLERQTFSQWPCFPHLLQVELLAGHEALGWRFRPQK